MADPARLSEEAIALHREGRLAEAEQRYAQILALTPDDIGTQFNRSLALMDMGRTVEALLGLERVLTAQPGFADALNAAGNCLRRLRRFDEALARYDRAIREAPDNPGFHYNRGLALTEMGRFADALAADDRALALAPDFVPALNNRGLALLNLGRPAEAVATLDQALALHPDMPEAWNNRGNAMRELAQPQDAVKSFDRAMALHSGIAELWNNRGGAWRDMGRMTEALADYDKALSLNPDLAEALYNRGNLQWTHHRRFEAALKDMERAALLDPDSDYVRGDLLHLRLYGGDWRDFTRARDAIIAGVHAGRRVVEPFVFQALSESPKDLQDCAILTVERRWPHIAPAWPAAPRAGKKIRLGYVSGEFRDQATAYLMAGVYEAHDRDKFEVIAIDNGGSDGSPLRQRLETGFDRMLDISRLTDAEAAARIRAEEIDILINLNGYFGQARMGVFARRPAPVQVNYLGFPGTLGSPAMDYILADRAVIPEAEQRFYTEQVAWLPDCYQANDAKRPIAEHIITRAEEGLPGQGFVFCNFNQSYKLLPPQFALWMDILKRVPGSVLWLLENNALFPQNLRREAEKAGVAGERLVFARRLPVDAHLARLKLADLALDSLPYNAHTTASDALWAGLPLLTCRGKTFPGRVGASLLSAIGLPELITENLDDYRARAVELATDPARLAALKQKLAANRLTTPLFDTARFTRHIESAYAQMLETSRRGAHPQSFTVPPAR